MSQIDKNKVRAAQLFNKHYQTVDGCDGEDAEDYIDKEDFIVAVAPLFEEIDRLSEFIRNLRKEMFDSSDDNVWFWQSKIDDFIDKEK